MNFRTLIELYDNRPLENVLCVDIFRPEQVIYICSQDTPPTAEKQLKRYFDHRRIKVHMRFIRTDLFDVQVILGQLRSLLQAAPDVAIDITGGTDAVLFAVGLACAEFPVPVLTYSQKQNRFYNIQDASFAHQVDGYVTLSVEDCFLMAGGSLRKGRVDNSILVKYLDDIDPFFRLFLKHRTRWDRIVTWIQRVSPADENGQYSLDIHGGYTVKGDRGARIPAPEEALRDLEDIRMISDLRIQPEESVSFRFRDRQIRAWLRDVGSVLELFVYKSCFDSGLFDDVITSAVVDWNGTKRNSAVSNELDVMCTRGVIPVFISCKTSPVRTEALNELAILRDRFGGKMARAALVTAECAGSPARNRAAELNIRIIDLNDIQDGDIQTNLRSLMV